MIISYQIDMQVSPETANHNKRWSNEEDAMLLEELKNRYSTQIIAQNHQRTVEGIEYRKVKLAINMSRNQTDKQYICFLFDFNINQLKDYIKDYRKYQKITLKDKKEYDVIQQSNTYTYDTRLLSVLETMTKSVEELRNIISNTRPM